MGGVDKIAPVCYNIPIWGTLLTPVPLKADMTLLGKDILSKFISKHTDAAGPIQAWVKEVETSTWKSPADIKARYPSASIINKLKVVFNIKGNTYRILASVSYPLKLVRALKLGTHAEYSKWDAIQ